MHHITLRTRPAYGTVWYSAVQWTRGGRGTVRVCITGSYSLSRGRDGNAESVKLHESLGEGKRQGEREEKGNGGQGRLGKMHSMTPRHSFHYLFVNVELTVRPVLPQAFLLS